MNIKWGDFYCVDLTPVVGSEQGGIRSVLIIQSDMGNRHSPTVIATVITDSQGKKPFHTQVWRWLMGLEQEYTILLEQVRIINRVRLKKYIS